MNTQGKTKHDIDNRPIAVCLHASASSSRQWRALQESLGRFRVVAPELIGYGANTWHPRSVLSSADEVARVIALIEEFDTPVHLIGHSYGGAIATMVAMAIPERITSLALFEPVLFPLLFAAGAASGPDVWRLQTDVRRCVREGKPASAAQRFVDYWNGDGAWEGMPKPVQDSIARRTPKVAAEFAALLATPINEDDMRQLRMPTLLLQGTQSPASTRDICDHLGTLIPKVRCTEMPGLGHMGPLDEPEQVNQVIAEFVSSRQASNDRQDHSLFAYSLAL